MCQRNRASKRKEIMWMSRPAMEELWWYQKRKQEKGIRKRAEKETMG